MRRTGAPLIVVSLAVAVPAAAQDLAREGSVCDASSALHSLADAREAAWTTRGQLRHR